MTDLLRNRQLYNVPKAANDHSRNDVMTPIDLGTSNRVILKTTWTHYWYVQYISSKGISLSPCSAGVFTSGCAFHIKSVCILHFLFSRGTGWVHQHIGYFTPTGRNQYETSGVTVVPLLWYAQIPSWLQIKFHMSFKIYGSFTNCQRFSKPIPRQVFKKKLNLI
jgi:hypothetical protein